MRRFALLLAALATMAVYAPAVAAEVKTFTPVALQSAQAAGKPVVVHVTASWCTTCQAQNAVLDRLLKEPKYKDVLLLKIDFDKDKTNMHKLGVQDRSTFVAFKGKTQVARSSGDTEPNKIHQLFDQTLQ